MNIGGIECRRVFTLPEKEKDYYAVIPLKILPKLGKNSARIKLLVLLYCYGGMNYGRWFTLSNRIVEGHGITRRQKNKILDAFESAGLLKLKKELGHPTRIKLTTMKNL